MLHTRFLLQASILIFFVALLIFPTDFDFVFFASSLPPAVGNIVTENATNLPQTPLHTIPQCPSEGLYSYHSTPDALFVAAPPTRRYDILFAHLGGPNDEHFACFLTYQGDKFTCTDAQHLKPGVWKVSIFLMRQTNDPPNGDLLSTSVVSYISQNNFASFSNDYLSKSGTSYPKCELLTFTWTKETSPNTGDNNNADHEAAPAAAALAGISTSPPRCRTDPLGIWEPLLQGECQPHQCSGTVDMSLFDSPYNKQWRIQHVYRPFECIYHFYSKDEARGCLTKARPLFVGDSRYRHLLEHIEHWLGPIEGLERIDVEFPHHLGLQALLHSPEKSQKLRDALIDDGRAVFIGTILHDVADFGMFSSSKMNEIKVFLEPGECPQCTDEDTANACGCYKRYAPQRYLKNIERLGSLIQDCYKESDVTAQNSTENSKDALAHDDAQPPRRQRRRKHFWISLDKPPIGHTRVFPWQTADILYDLGEYAHHYLTQESIGLSHIDLRLHTLMAPTHWWDDYVHYGRNETSFFQHTSLQILLNHLCEDD